MMDPRCVDALHGNNNNSNDATSTTFTVLPPTPTMHAQNKNRCTSVSIPGMAMSIAAQDQDFGLNNNDTDMMGNEAGSSLEAAMTLSLAAEDASNVPPLSLSIPNSTTMQAIGAPVSTQSPTPATSSDTQSLEIDSRNTSVGRKSSIALRTEAAILASPDTIVSRPLPPQNQHEAQAAAAAADETSMGSQTAVSQQSLTSVAHSIVSPITTESDPLAKAPPTKQNSVNHHNLVPTASTMLNPSVEPSSVPTNPSLEAVSIHHRPTTAAPSPTPAVVGTSHALNSYPMTNIIVPPPSPDGRFKNTVCPSTVAAGPGGADGLSPKKKCAHPLRRGKWTAEEESYANHLIHEFKSGLLPLTDGTTLRNFLSKLLNCDPMRISKKFVGNNCIGKQVFRRRVPEINRLTPEQMRTMCLELSELERRFFDRVAQTNRVKPSGVANTLGPGSPMVGIGLADSSTTVNMMNIGGKIVMELENIKPPTPPWLRPPRTYKPKGKFARKCVVATTVPSSCLPNPTDLSAPAVGNVKFVTEKSIRKSELSNVANDGIPRTESALEQLARTASAAKFVEDIVSGEIALEREGMGDKLSQSTLQGSFEALMSMDLQSVENLVELAATSNSSAILSELNKNYSESLKYNQGSSANLSARMESFIKSLSNANLFKTGLDSQQALGCLLNASCSNFFDAEKFFKKDESSTAFPQLNGEERLDSGSNNSVEDFLSLVASGDIPHQDPNLLQVPLQKIMQSSGAGSTAVGSKRKLSQQQLVALASRLAPRGNSSSKKRKKK